MAETLAETLADVMSTDVPIVSPETSLADAAVLMLERGTGALIVARDGGGYGIISDRDMTRAASESIDAGQVKVADRHTRDIVQAAPGWSLQRAAATMARGGFRHLLIVDGDGDPVGMVSIRDLLRALMAEETIEAAAAEEDAEETEDLLYSYRRTAKQHLVAASCRCELDWVEVLEGQLEARPQLGADELRNLWESRGACPRLLEVGGAD